MHTMGTAAIRVALVEQRGQTKARKKTGYGETGKEACLVGFSEGEETMTIRVAIYARVSTLNNRQNPEMQLRELTEYCQRRGWEIAGEYIDEGVSGTKDRRPQLDRMMNAARSREFDVLLVWKLDRFARSLKHLVTAIADFEALGVQFVSLRDNLDLTTPR